MQTKPAAFRDRLLDAQPFTSNLREEYRKELDLLLNHRLTTQTRLATWGGLFAALAFAGLCIRSLISPQANGRSIVVAAAVGVASILTSVWLARVLRQGGFVRRTSFALTESVGSIVVGAVVLTTLIGGMNAPTDPASTFGALWGLSILIVGFAWGTGNRITASTLETREHLLRLESRLADLAERCGPA